MQFETPWLTSNEYENRLSWAFLRLALSRSQHISLKITMSVPRLKQIFWDQAIGILTAGISLGCVARYFCVSQSAIYRLYESYGRTGMIRDWSEVIILIQTIRISTNRQLGVNHNLWVSFWKLYHKAIYCAHYPIVNCRS